MDTLFVQKSVSFHHFPWFPSPGPSENDGFWSSGHTFCEKKCVVLTFSINLAGVLASQTRIISFIYKTEVVLENIFFRISSFIYELRRVLRRRLYATRNFPVWAPTWAPWEAPNRGRRRNLDIPIGFQRFRDIPRPPLSALETSSSFVLYLFVSFKGLGAAVKWEERRRS